MPSFESPALYIDFARLPPPKVIEEIKYEDLLTVYKQQVLAKNPRLAAALNLEQSPTNVILEAEAYGEMIVRERINSAAKACMLPFATGSDLEVIGARFNVSRMAGELDPRLRRRIQLSMESYTTAGSPGSYIFHSLSTSTDVRDATAVTERGTGRVIVTIMANGANPVPSAALIDAIYDRLMSDGIKPLTDDISVLPVIKIPTDIQANITLYPGPDASLVISDINKALTSLRNRVTQIGMDLKRSAVIAALTQEGVQNVDIDFSDINVGTNGVVWINSASVNVSNTREE
ncbi:baseplate assembly protein [Bradyrhizobium ottawaense]|uniref:Phage-related baseplate assembly protein n=1 Tax=Bradyrhizobium ottawaense TaxID=931866 RepID=A0ABY0QH94_9BRAD|nr:baseplate J/gp47 family protein [Bradyrhizobium ottawaense]SDK40317.1 Phage-related baseplate assembly protein [Bradyrhizobium ottawaense]